MRIPIVLKPKKLILLLLLPFVMLGVFTGINVADYWRYRYIVNLDKHLTTADYEAMVEAVKKHSPNSDIYSGSKFPDEFEKIGAKSMRAYERHASFDLYSRGENPKGLNFYTYANFTVDVFDRNARVRISENFSGKVHSKTLWVSDPLYEEQVDPTNRIVTISWWTTEGAKKWVVLPDAISFISPHQYVGVDAILVEKKSITILQTYAIGGAMDLISKQAHGKLYMESGVVDGAQMEIRFSPDGSASADDIMLSNAWCAELEPLLDLLRENAPHGDEIPKKEIMVREYEYGYPPQKYVGDYTIKSIEEWRAYPPLETDWWIVWPKLFFKKPAVVLEAPQS